MFTEEIALNILKDLKDPFLNKRFEETNGIMEVKVKAEKKHVSVKLAIAKTNTPEQLQLQQQVVKILKEGGAESVGIRFAETSTLDTHLDVEEANAACLAQ